MDIQPCGCLPFKVYPKEGDRLVLCPAYVFPIEVFERGLMTRVKYLFQTVVVNGYDGRAELVDGKCIEPDVSFDISLFEAERLEVKISGGIAAEIAKYDSAPKDSRGWRRIVLNRNIAVCADKMKLVWRVYIVRGPEVVDAFSGECMKSAGLLGMLFS